MLFLKEYKWVILLFVSTFLGVVQFVDVTNNLTSFHWRIAFYIALLVCIIYVSLFAYVKIKGVIWENNLVNELGRKTHGTFILSILFFTLIGILNYTMASPNYCDPESDEGCILGFESEEVSESTGVKCVEGGMVYDFSGINIYAGGNTRTYVTYLYDYKTRKESIGKIGFPNTDMSIDSRVQRMKTGQLTVELPKEENFKGLPYRLWLDYDKLAFSGDIKDFKSNEIIGWFNENEFGVIGQNNYSWNRDDRGIEILDNYGYVCFSVEIIEPGYDKNGIYRGKGIEFKGYFKQDDYYYIYDKTFTKTRSLKKAEKLISNIKRNFVHKGSNSCGVRET